MAAKWGWIEHRWEGYSSFLLLIGAAGAVLYWFTHWSWIITILPGWMVGTFLVHLVARTAHHIEKYLYKRGGYGRSR